MADGLKLIVSKIVSSADSVFERKKKVLFTQCCQANHIRKHEWHGQGSYLTPERKNCYNSKSDFQTTALLALERKNCYNTTTDFGTEKQELVQHKDCISHVIPVTIKTHPKFKVLFMIIILLNTNIHKVRLVVGNTASNSTASTRRPVSHPCRKFRNSPQSLKTNFGVYYLKMGHDCWHRLYNHFFRPTLMRL